jgi:hypothetical protein
VTTTSSEVSAAGCAAAAGAAAACAYATPGAASTVAIAKAEAVRVSAGESRKPFIVPPFYDAISPAAVSFNKQCFPAYRRRIMIDIDVNIADGSANMLRGFVYPMSRARMGPSRCKTDSWRGEKKDGRRASAAAVNARLKMTAWGGYLTRRG